MKILDGKKLSEKILRELKREIEKKQLKLKLAVVLVGKNPASEIFALQKQKACEKAGIGFQLFKFSLKISPAGLKKEIEKIVKNPAVSGVVIQMPLPKGFNCQEFLNLIPPEKDIDVLSEISLGRFYAGAVSILPPTISGISHLLKKYKISVKGKNIALIGAGRLVGSPSALWLLKEKATFSVADEFTKDISFFTKRADIIISGAGKPNLIKGKMVKRGVVVIDAGTLISPRKTGEGRAKLIGDIDFKTVSKKASYISPVPGGVGPMTVACLLKNLVKLNKS